LGIFFSIFKSISFKTTITSIGLWIAVNKLLLRELEKITCL
jgi:hypothetical protein